MQRSAHSREVQKIQQITILKNAIPCSNVQSAFKKYNKLQSLRTKSTIQEQDLRFKKYNKLQSLRTSSNVASFAICSKNTTNYNP